jgi:hypothetical protein
LLLTLGGLAACGGGGGADSSADSGEVVIALTDAPGDFATYTVDVLSLKLTRADGTQVETLPLNTRVDFALYTEVSEFLTAATLPNGRYVQGSMLLDYSNADIQVEDADGNAVPVTAIVDGIGDPIDTLEVEVSLEGVNALPVAPGIPRSLLLDFDLEQSNSLVFAGSDITLSVEPVLIATVDTQTPGVHLLRGPLQSVNLDDSAFSLFIRPFFHPIRTGARRFGGLDVHTDDNTFYEIDGVGYQAEPGLQVLNTLTSLSAVSVRGELRFQPLRFEASEVYAGSSVPGGELDVVRGSVVQRQGDVLTIRGATLIRQDGTVVFNDQVSVQLDQSTRVTKQSEMELFDIDDISVGQRIEVFGILTNDDATDLQLSAANGYARMLQSRLQGSVEALPGGGDWLALALTSINQRSVELYDFAGTGVDAGSDADPAFYEVDSGSLPLEIVELDEVAVVSGFPTPFGSAAPDFTAQTLAAP